MIEKIMLTVVAGKFTTESDDVVELDELKRFVTSMEKKGVTELEVDGCHNWNGGVDINFVGKIKRLETDEEMELREKGNIAERVAREERERVTYMRLKEKYEGSL